MSERKKPNDTLHTRPNPAVTIREHGDIIFVADPHVEHSFKAGNVSGERQSSLTLDVIGGIIRERQPKHVVVLGDFFDAFGQIEASAAVMAQEAVSGWTKSGCRVYFVLGNHEYQDVKEEYFGKSIISALFGGMESQGIFVIDALAKFIRMEEGLVLLGLPYRETWDQFQATCLPTIDAYFAGPSALVSGDNGFGDVPSPGDKVIVGWHVGLPFGEDCWRGDENENGWISADHEAVKKIFQISSNKTVFCGHYHGPASVPCADYGKFIYVGSPATRSRSESDQQKRVLRLTHDGELEAIPTWLILDKIVPTVDDAANHLADLAERFGKDVRRIATVHIILPEGSTLDDYNIVRERVVRIEGDVRVERPKVINRSKVDHIVERLKTDKNYSKAQMEIDISRVALFDYFRSRELKNLSKEAMESLAKMDVRVWTKLYWSMLSGRDEIEAKSELGHEATAIGLDLGALGELTPDSALSISRFIRTYKNFEWASERS